MTGAAIQAFELQLDSDSPSPRNVRRVVSDHFAAYERLDDLLLCVSEVVTNAVLHGRAPIRVAARIHNGSIRVEVSDGSEALPIPRSPHPATPTGRGLRLLDSLTSQWGTDPTSGGKSVWFVMDGAVG